MPSERSDETLIGASGPGWPAPPSDDDAVRSRSWIDARAHPAVLRDTVPLAVSGLIAVERGHLAMKLDAPWLYRPEPDSEADVDQAISAKVRLGVMTVPMVGRADLVVVDPEQAQRLIDDDKRDLDAVFFEDVQLPAPIVFLDLEGRHGRPVVPAPGVHLRGALCWRCDDVLSVVPYGSFGGRHPWGGTDYQAWGRWCLLPANDWPEPGRGDFLVGRQGDVVSWVAMDDDSICAFQGRLTRLLVGGALRVLQRATAMGGSAQLARLPRPARRRAARDGHEIGLVYSGLPGARDEEEPEALEDFSAFTVVCPVEGAHLRINRAHARWHEALDAYDDPDAFVAAVNDTLADLRSSTLALQAQLKKGDPEDLRWYEEDVRPRLRADPLMKWLKDSRDTVVHAKDLLMHSKATVRIVGPGLVGAPSEIEVDPSRSSGEIARTITLPPVSTRTREEGTLVVERRWVFDEHPERELLDLLAYGHAMLARIVAEAHIRAGKVMSACRLTGDDRCQAGDPREHPSGRLPCMGVGREARTSRRSLSSGAPEVIDVVWRRSTEADRTAAKDRYPTDDATRYRQDAHLLDNARGLHARAREILVADGYHGMLAWLFASGRMVQPVELRPDDQRSKFLMMERLAEEVRRVGADGVVITTEAWMAPLLDGDDPRAELWAGERSDRSEALLTHAMDREGRHRTLMSPMERGLDGKVMLGEVSEQDGSPIPAAQAILDVWASWPPASASR